MAEAVLSRLTSCGYEPVNPDAPYYVQHLTPGRGPETNRYDAYQRVWVKFDIQPGEKVLDIGSGHIPFPLATALADLYEGDTDHRAKAALVKDARPFAKCSIETMPFADGEFDFVYCSHVLEHVQHPGRACREIMRIGRRGYIETPTRTSDVMFNFTRLKGHHQWYIQLVDHTLVFIEWTDAERRDLGVGDFLELFHSRWDNPFQQLVGKNRDMFVNMLLWKRQFSFVVIDKRGTIVDQHWAPRP